MFFSGIGQGGDMGALNILNFICTGPGQRLGAQHGNVGLEMALDGHQAWNDFTETFNSWQVNHGLPSSRRQPSHDAAPNHNVGGGEGQGSDAALQAAIAQSLRDAAAAAAQKRAAQQEQARRLERERRELEMLAEAAAASGADLALQEVLLRSSAMGNQGQAAAVGNQGQPAAVGNQGHAAAVAKPRRQHRARRGQAPHPGSTVYAEMMEVFHRKAQLTRAEYRRILERQGLIQPEDDIDISHIIAEENGGANHPDNLVCMGRSLNRRLQHRGDHLMVYQVGLAKARKAVAASRLYGNATRGLYEGRSAEELYAEGHAAMGRAL